MQNLYRYHMGYVNGPVCDDIIKKYSGKPLEKGFTDDNNSDKIRKSNITWIDDLSYKQEIFSIANYFNNNYFGFDFYPDFNHNDLQFTEYDSKYEGKYDWHVDTNPETFNERKLSIIIQLSDEDSYEGGDIIFKTSSNDTCEASFRAKGTVIAFPSFILHKVTPVTSGTRHSLVSWINGPSWK